MTSSLTRPLAVVTGASSGIGYELAKQFAQMSRGRLRSNFRKAA